MALPLKRCAIILKISGLICCLFFTKVLPAQNELLDSLVASFEVQTTIERQLHLSDKIAKKAIADREFATAKKYARLHSKLASQHDNKEAVLAAQKALIRAYYYERNRDSSLLYLTDYVSLATTLDNQMELGWAFNFYGLIYKNKGENKLAIENFEKSQKIRSAIGHLSGVASCHNNLGLVYQQIGDYEKAIDCYLQSLAIRKEQGDERRMSNIHLNLGNLYSDIGDFTKGLEYNLKVLAYYESIGDQEGLASIYNNMGNNQKAQGNTEQALNYYKESLKLARILDDKPLIAILLGNIGNVYGQKGAHQKNKSYLLESLAIEKELGNLDGIARSYLNLGVTLMDLEDYTNALNYLLESNKIYKEQNTIIQIANTNIELGRVYLKMGNYQAAIQFLQEGLNTTKNTNNWTMQGAAYQALAQTYRGLGDYQRAFEHFKQYTAAKDSLLNIEKTKQLAQMSAQYEYEKSQAAIQTLRAEKVTEQLEMSEKLANRNLLVGLALVGMVLMLTLYLLYRYRQKQKEAINEKQRVEELLRIDQLKDQFLANTSHELRTPLNGIIGLASSLEEGIAGDLPSKAKDDLHLITQSGKRLSNLINDILDLSKLKNADLNLDLKPIDMYAATNIVFAISRPLIQNRPIQLVNQLSPNIPLLEADENRLQQILLNLIGNAIKFTEEGSVRVSGQVNGDSFELSITDTGIGIPADKQAAIFNSFEQLDGSTTRNYSGTGLGLSITKQLIELHHGKIWLVSEVGEGSTFTFSLPISQKQGYYHKTKQAERFIKRPPIKQPALKNNATIAVKKIKPIEQTDIRILIVDDEMVNRQVLENHLQLEGYASVSVADGIEAIALMDEGAQFDLIILDVMMPRLSGYTVCNKLRERFSPAELPIILLTAKTGINDLLEGFDSGANDFVTKPFSKDELISRIKIHLNLYHLNKASARFVPHEFLRAIGRQSISDLRLGDNAFKNVTVMFADIRDYTTLSEQMSPEENFKFVNAFLRRLVPYIQDNHGFVNQFLGDGFMAIFPDSENYALKAAIEIQHKLKEYNAERIAENRLPIRLGLGLNAGPLIMGIIGDNSRTDPAVISDTVNTASRMEGLTKHYGVNIIVSERFVQRLENPDHYNFRFLGKVKVKGKEKSTGIYEGFDGDSPEVQSLKLLTMDAFDKGIHAFISGDFKQARTHFLEVIAVNKADNPAQYFLKKSNDYLANGVSEYWDGIELLGAK